jgi:hypothetical protein
MENNFDRLIKQKLEKLDVEYNPSDWERMEEKIVEQSELNPAIEDVYLDGMVYDTLNDVDVQYNPAHWEMMKARLEDPYAIRRRLMKYKVLEVAFVALLLITIGRLIPFEKVKIVRDNTPIEQIENEGVFNQIATVETNHEEEKNSGNTKNKAQIIELPSVSKDLASSTDKPNTQNNALRRIHSNEGFQASETIESLIETKTSDVINPIEKGDATDINNTPIKQSPTEVVGRKTDQAVTFKEQLVEESDQALSNFESFEPSEQMNTLRLKDAGLFPVSQVDEMDGSRVLTALPKSINVRIGMLLGPDANYVMTPSNQSKNLDVFNQYALGYSGGFTLGFNYGRWEIETGALYSSVTYDSRNIFEIKGSFADGGYVQQGLEGAQLDILKVPLNLKFNFTEQGKWNVYIFSGVSANAALETFYKITTRDLGLSDASRNFAGRAPSPPDIEPTKAQENFDGIFEGGVLSKNLFYTANIGLGLERYFTPRMSVFLQPNFQYQFSKGLGPQTDRINTVSLLMGAKVTLKRRKKN